MDILYVVLLYIYLIKIGMVDLFFYVNINENFGNWKKGCWGRG